MQNRTDQDDVVQGAADPELELMLDEAFDAPAVPRSLLKRIDQAVQQEWGVSPALAQQEPTAVGRVAAGGSTLLLKAWPIAASLALITAAFVLLQNNAHAYSWAKLVKALAETGVVESSSEDGSTTRWVSVSNKVVGQRSSTESQLFDFDRGTMLRRQSGSQAIERRPFNKASYASDREAVVVAFLLDNLAEEGTSIRQSELQLVSETWASRNDDTVLHVKLESETDAAELTIVIDPDTHLPKTCQVAGRGAVVTRSLFYPATDAKELLAAHFPADLPIVNVAASTTAIAANAAESVPAREPGGLLAPTEGDSQKFKLAASAPLVGAASLQWKAVEVKKFSSTEATERVDAILEGLWRDNGIDPAPPASDEELLRRIYLDLAGRTPSVSEVRAFLADEAPDRYTKLVDRLLASRDHATHLATVWRTYLIPEGLDLSRFGGTQSFEKWIGRQFVEGVPYDEVVRRLLLAEGRLTQSGPLLFYAATKLDPDQIATRSSRVFLGMRLDCAQCHDDHFEPWLQEDFWGYAAFFARISRPQGVLNNVSTVLRVRDIDHGEVTLPESETTVPPRFLDGTPIDSSPAAVARRRQLATWLTADHNPYFARATANRVWGQLFGKGIVDPVDGFGTQHKPVSQELLDELAGYFIASNYDLRGLFRTITRSRAYQLSSGADTTGLKRRELFAQMDVKLLTAEQMYDCITVASMLASAESGTGFNLDRVGNTSRDQFLQQFRAPPGRPTEYQSGIPQALTLMNGGLISSATGLASSGLLKTLEVPLITNKDRIDILYMATLSRRPTASEQELLSEYINDESSGQELYESLADVLWALLNSAEFTMNH